MNNYANKITINLEGMSFSMTKLLHFLNNLYSCDMDFDECEYSKSETDDYTVEQFTLAESDENCVDYNLEIAYNQHKSDIHESNIVIGCNHLGLTLKYHAYIEEIIIVEN